MPKHIDSEILGVLRQFHVADETSSKKNITDIKQYPERMLSRLVGFRFNRRQYYALFDNAVGDEKAAILDHIAMDEPSLNGELILNPLEKKSDTDKAYGMPYKVKDVYRFVVAWVTRRCP